MQEELTPQEYGEELQKDMDELCISQEELAKAIGKGQKTLSRYIRGENKKLPDDFTQWQIYDYLQSCRSCLGYEHKSAKEFGELLRKLLKELNVTQARLAENIGKTQKDISNYLNGSVNTKVEVQYDILNHLRKIAQYRLKIDFHDSNNRRIIQDNVDYLNNILHIGEEDDDLSHEDWEDMLGFPYDDDCCLMRIMILPDSVRALIYNCYHAFFEMGAGRQSPVLYTHFQRGLWMRRIRRMSEAERKYTVAKLEENAHPIFPTNEAEEKVFKTVNAINSVISRKDLFSVNGTLNLPADINETDEEWLYAKDMFSDLLHEIGTCDFCIQDINEKLTFTREEWYIWLLLMINACNKTLPYTNP